MAYSDAPATRESLPKDVSVPETAPVGVIGEVGVRRAGERGGGGGEERQQRVSVASLHRKRVWCVECVGGVMWGGMGWGGMGWAGVGWGGVGWVGLGWDGVGCGGMGDGVVLCGVA